MGKNRDLEVNLVQTANSKADEVKCLMSKNIEDMVKDGGQLDSLQGLSLATNDLKFKAKAV